MNTERPLISVCMPVYNAERFVAEAVKASSARRLATSSSSFSTMARRTAHLRFFATTLIAIRGFDDDPAQPRVGQIVERVGPPGKEAKSIARMDADDVSLPERFQREIDYLRVHPQCVLVGSRVLLVDAEGDPLCDWCTMQDHEAIDSSICGASAARWFRTLS